MPAAPPKLPAASLLPNSSAAGEDGEGAGGDGDARGESAAGKTPLPDGSTWSPITTPPPRVGGTPLPDGSTRSPTVTPPPTVAAEGTIAPTLADEILPPESLILANRCGGVQCVTELSPSYTNVYIAPRCSEKFDFNASMRVFVHSKDKAFNWFLDDLFLSSKRCYSTVKLVYFQWGV